MVGKTQLVGDLGTERDPNDIVARNVAVYRFNERTREYIYVGFYKNLKPGDISAAHLPYGDNVLLARPEPTEETALERKVGFLSRKWNNTFRLFDK